MKNYKMKINNHIQELLLSAKMKLVLESQGKNGLVMFATSSPGLNSIKQTQEEK